MPMHIHANAKSYDKDTQDVIGQEFFFFKVTYKERL